jgi:hypothetical protein
MKKTTITGSHLLQMIGVKKFEEIPGEHLSIIILKKAVISSRNDCFEVKEIVFLPRKKQIIFKGQTLQYLFSFDGVTLIPAMMVTIDQKVSMGIY